MNLYQDEIKCTQLVNKIFKTADVDGSGTLDYTEFVVAYSELQNLTAKEKLETTFKLFDKDGNGTISKPELQEILGGLALQDNQWNSMFEELDINGDGEVTYEEFTQRLIRDT